MRRGIRLKIIIGAGLCAVSFAAAQGSAAERWVTSWTTALQSIAPARTGLPPQPRRTGPEASNLPAAFADQTVRMIVRVSLGGRRIRVELSNMANAQPLEVGSAHIGVHKGTGAIVEGTDRVL